MKKAWGRIRRPLTVIFAAVIAVILLFLLVRAVGKALNSRAPEGGINESMYVEINGTEQWISIYGEDKSNPVLLYLHGGPGSPTSAYDYAFTREWADVYTVVTWDQRNCGKSYSEEQNSIELTYELMMSDGLAMTKYLLNYLDKEKITLLGHSWGTYFGCNLVLACPEYYDCYIGTGQLVDMDQNEAAFLEAAAEWVGTDEEGVELLASMDPGHFSTDYFTARNRLMEKYGYDILVDGTDYNLPAAIIFNPYYSLLDWAKVLNADSSIYMNFLLSDEFEKFSLLGRTGYEVPYFNINGDRDYQTNYILAQEYFDEVTAPEKELYIMEDTTHGLLESKSEAFSDILHEIAEKRN